MRLRTTVIATVQEDLRDRDAVDLLHDISRMIEQAETRGVILDLSIVETMDSFLGRLFGDVANVAQLLGALTVLVGMKPSVAITLVELGVNLDGVATALSLEKGLSLLRRATEGEDRRGRH